LRHIAAGADKKRGKNHQITHGAYSLTDHDDGCDLTTIAIHHGGELRYLCEKDERSVNTDVFGGDDETIEKTACHFPSRPGFFLHGPASFRR
jgi:hypothetical protein